MSVRFCSFVLWFLGNKSINCLISVVWELFFNLVTASVLYRVQTYLVNWYVFILQFVIAFLLFFFNSNSFSLSRLPTIYQLSQPSSSGLFKWLVWSLFFLQSYQSTIFSTSADGVVCSEGPFKLKHLHLSSTWQTVNLHEQSSGLWRGEWCKARSLLIFPLPCDCVCPDKVHCELWCLPPCENSTFLPSFWN